MNYQRQIVSWLLLKSVGQHFIETGDVFDGNLQKVLVEIVLLFESISADEANKIKLC